MKKFGFRLLRKKTIQASARTSLAASTTVPDSGFAFVTNSQGASGALVEFTNAVSAALDFVDLEEDSEDGPFKSQLSKLESAVGEFSNSTVESCHSLTNWTTTKATADLVSVAFQCAATVYECAPKGNPTVDSDHTFTLHGHRDPEAVGFTFSEIDYAKPSIGGTAKAMGVWKVDPKVFTSSEHLPAVVIAIRGTAGPLDHMVNINSRPVSGKDFLLSGKHSFLNMYEDISAHSGFVSGAKALIPRVMASITKARSQNVQHIVLTGHSAGGAVASLVFLKLLLTVADTDPSLKFSCITFGAPPTLTHGNVDIMTALRTDLNLKERLGLNLAFVNEFDIVPRADHTYIRSMIDIYRSIYDLPPLMINAVVEKDNGAEQNYILPPLVFDEDFKSNIGIGDVVEQDCFWKLPKAEYNIIGDLVLLRKERVKGQTGMILVAQSISLREYQTLVYCGIETHSRTHYGERVNLLQQGNFNHNMSW